MVTAEYAADYLTERAAKYGGTLGDMLSKTPVCLWDNPDELMEFWSEKDLSHIFPQSTHPHLAEVWSNIVAEDASINRARGAAVMTEEEVSSAWLDSQSDAEVIDIFTLGDDEAVTEVLLELAA
jgi:hypothetical protein